MRLSRAASVTTCAQRDHAFGLRGDVVAVHGPVPHAMFSTIAIALSFSFCAPKTAPAIHPTRLFCQSDTSVAVVGVVKSMAGSSNMETLLCREFPHVDRAAGRGNARSIDDV